MANVNIRTPRFYCDYINFLDSRDVAGGHYGIETGTNQINFVNTAIDSVAELYDMKPLNQVEFNTTGDTDGTVNLWLDLKTSGFRVDFVAILNHNMHSADAKVRVSNSDTLSSVKSVDHQQTITVDSLTPGNTAWQTNQTHGATAQFVTSGSGTGMTCSIVTTADTGVATFTIVTGGVGYAVDDTVTFRDPGNTINTAVLTIATASSNTFPTLISRLGVEAVSNNLAQSDDTDSWGRGHTIIEFSESNARYWGIQFEGMNSQTNLGANNGTFDGSTNLKIGCILLGQYYDMPNSPDLSVKRSIKFDGVNTQESLGGQRYATMTNSGRQNISGSNKSPFHTYYNTFGAYGGRMTYDMKFSYLASTDVMPNNYYEFQNTDEAVVEDVWNKTNGRHIPFIFTQNSGSTDYSDYLFARFAQNSLDMTQVAPDVFDVSMKIEEEF